MYIQYIHEVDRSQTPGMRPVLTRSWSCAYIPESAAFVLFHSSHTPRYSFQVMRCKALTVPHDSAMLRCSLYLLLSDKGPNGAQFFKKEKSIHFQTQENHSERNCAWRDDARPWQRVETNEHEGNKNSNASRARVCMCIQSTLPIEELKRQKTGENPIHKKSKINPALVKQFLKCTITI